MATPPPLEGKEIGWPPPNDCKYPPDAAHEWVADVENEIVVDVKGRPYLLTPLVKRYLDPYGLMTKLPRKLIEDGSCPLCRSIDVSKTQDIYCSWEKQLTQALINPFILLVVLRRIPVLGTPSVVQEEEEVDLPLDDEVKNSFTNIAR